MNSASKFDEISEFIPQLVVAYCSYLKGDKTAGREFGRQLKELLISRDDFGFVMPRLLFVLLGLEAQYPDKVSRLSSAIQYPAHVANFAENAFSLLAEGDLPQDLRPRLEALASMKFWLTRKERQRLLPGSIADQIATVFFARITEISSRFFLTGGDQPRNLIFMAHLQAALLYEIARQRDVVEFGPLRLVGWKPSPTLMRGTFHEYTMVIDACKRSLSVLQQRVAAGGRDVRLVKDECLSWITEAAAQTGDYAAVLQWADVAVSHFENSAEGKEAALWRVYWAKAVALAALHRFASSLDAFSTAAEFAFTMPASRLFVPENAEDLARVFKNARISAQTQLDDENLQGFFDAWHSLAVKQSSTAISLGIADEARRFAGPFANQTIAFPGEEKILAELPDSVGSVIGEAATQVSGTVLTRSPVSESCSRPFISYFVSTRDNAVYIYYCSKSAKIKYSKSALEMGVFGRNQLVSDLDYAKLYDLLIGPVQKDMLADVVDQTLTIVPHSFLWGIPYAALGGAPGNQLIDKYALRFAFNTAQANAPAPNGISLNTALIVANPQRKAASQWGPLEAASKSKTELKEAYGAELQLSSLSEKAATKPAVYDAIGGKDLIHFSTHAFALATRPFGSSIVLSETPDDPGFLSVADIISLNIKPKLIYLASCQTGAGIELGSGPASFGAFLSRFGQIPTIVSTPLLNDQSSRWIENVFYRELSKHGKPAIALRQAQIIARKYAATPRHWGAGIAYWGP